MARLNVRSSSKRRVLDGVLKLKSVFEKLQKSLLLRRNKSSSSYYGDYDTTACVLEGHFAVIAEHEKETIKRFLVPLSYLRNSTFLGLLEQAAEEYGFDQHGALTIPCRPSELERFSNVTGRIQLRKEKHREVKYKCNQHYVQNERDQRCESLERCV
ncbi:hypothetical protein JHK84_033451 [Glycine max]|nr:hypothetical protein JHK86_033204 [Glycine max]KAG5139683.1 hypothetical protein JHK84_033451 [Glycine max]